MPRLDNEEKTITESSPRKRAPRRAVSKKSVGQTPRAATTANRRAPTSLTTSVTTSSNRSLKRYVILTVVMLAVVGSAALIGSSDTGVVDVQALIAEKEQNSGRANIDVANDGDGAELVPVQNTPPVVPVSIMKGRGVGSAPVTQSSSVAEETPVEENGEVVTAELVAEEGGTGTEANTTEQTPATEVITSESGTEIMGE